MGDLMVKDIELKRSLFHHYKIPTSLLYTLPEEPYWLCNGEVGIL